MPEPVHNLAGCIHEMEEYLFSPFLFAKNLRAVIAVN
jgi:hypothetical protein